MKGKKWIIMLCIATAAVLAAGCGSSGSGASNTGNANSVEEVLQNQIDKANGTASSDQSGKSTQQETVSDKSGDIYSTEGVDMDLTQLSDTMLYSQVSNMMTEADKYIGKMIRVPGDFAVAYSEENNQYYYACLITDQTACCSLGVEFELPETYKYPDDYPAEGEQITVQGVFDTYTEGPYTYCVLRNAKLAS